MATVKTSFKANSKALAEKESDGMAKMIYRWVSDSLPDKLLNDCVNSCV